MPRFFVEHRGAAFVLLLLALAWGVYGWTSLPRRKDPRIVVPVAAVVCPWPGAAAGEVERRLAIPLEDAVARTGGVDFVTAVCRDNLAVLRVNVEERLDDAEAVFDAIGRAVAAVPLPEGAGPVRLVRDRGDTAAALLAVTAPGLAPLDAASATVVRALEGLPEIAEVRRAGVLGGRVFVDIDPSAVAAARTDPRAMLARLATGPAFADEDELARHPLAPGVSLGDVATIGRDVEDPPQRLVHHAARAADGTWQRRPAIVLDVQAAPGAAIGAVGAAVARALDEVRPRLPEDVTVEVISDQAAQVAESLGLFTTSLFEAIALVVLVALVGFREPRSALLLALSIPLTLALTFGLMRAFGVDLQQVSTASLILALGLLVDDPVVAGDAIRRGLDRGEPPRTAAWSGPARLSRAILFATLTNIVAYLPLVLVRGNTGRFIASLPLVMLAALVASRVVSMTFVPFLAPWLLRAPRAPRGPSRLAGAYQRTGRWAMRHRWAVLAAAALVLAGGAWFASRLASQYFPRDLAHLFYVDLQLPDGAGVLETSEVAERAERIAAGLGPGLRSATTFAGGGAPRFWFALDPPAPRPEFAQIVFASKDRRATAGLAAALQRALDEQLPGVAADVRELEIGKPVGLPVQVRLAAPASATAALADTVQRVRAALAAAPGAVRVRDDLPAAEAHPRGPFARKLEAARAIGGLPAGTVAGTPVLVRIPPVEWPRLLAALDDRPTEPGPAWIVRREGLRTVTVGGFAASGFLPSEVLRAARPALDRIAGELPAGVRLEFGGEHEEQQRGFRDLALVLAASVALIFVALAIQFRSAVLPLLVFAAIPFGAAAAFASLWLLDAPFGFMAFLGVASLVGVTVSHIVVLFDGIEEQRAAGAPLEDGLLDAGWQRLRPVLVTAAATVFALVPLAARGGPLWEPLCYAQIGGLTVATLVTLLLVPVLYVVFVRDLRVLRW